MGTPIGTPDWGTQTALVRETTINFNTAVHIGPGVTVTLGAVPTKTGYSVYNNMLNFSGAGLIPLEYRVTWLDSAGPNIIGRQRWNMFAGTGAAPHTVIGHGPCESGFMEIKITNHHGTDTASVTCDIADVSQTYDRHDWRTDDTLPPVFAGFTYAGADTAAGIFGNLNQFSVPLNSVSSFMLPLYSGWATLAVDIAPTNSSAFDITNEADTVIGAGAILVRQVIQAAGIYTVNTPVCMPRSQCAYMASNFSTTAAMSVNMSLIAA